MYGMETSMGSGSGSATTLVDVESLDDKVFPTATAAPARKIPAPATMPAGPKLAEPAAKAPTEAKESELLSEAAATVVANSAAKSTPSGKTERDKEVVACQIICEKERRRFVE